MYGFKNLVKILLLTLRLLFDAGPFLLVVLSLEKGLIDSLGVQSALELLRLLCDCFKASFDASLILACSSRGSSIEPHCLLDFYSEASWTSSVRMVIKLVRERSTKDSDCLMFYLRKDEAVCVKYFAV